MHTGRRFASGPFTEDDAAWPARDHDAGHADGREDGGGATEDVLPAGTASAIFASLSMPFWSDTTAVWVRAMARVRFAALSVS